MKIWSVFSLVIVFHVTVIGLLMVQPGCQSQSATEPDPAMTAPQAGSAPVEPVVEEPLDPAFNSGITSSVPATTGRQMSAPTRPTGVTRTTPDTGMLEPVLEPVQSELSLPTIASEYTVKKGDNLTAIARREGVSLSALLSANGLTRSSTIYIGQVLKVPAEAAGEPNGGLEIEHAGKQIVVKKGDTLSKIASRAGTSVKVIKALNGLTSDTIFVGQKLALPEGAGAGVTRAPEPVNTEPVQAGSGYTVQPGDTPSGIARKFKVSTSALMAANNISDPRRLFVGQKLVIPDGSVTGTASTTVQRDPVVNQPLPTREETAAPTTVQVPAPAEPSEDDPMSILEALEDDDLPFVEVEEVEGGSQPGN
jgi:LysM repeat protein